jgi:hypothetical protein
VYPYIKLLLHTLRHPFLLTSRGRSAMTNDAPLPPVPPPGVYPEQQLQNAKEEVLRRGTEELVKMASVFIPQVQAARGVLKLTDLGFTSAELAPLLASKSRRKLPSALAKGVEERIIAYQGKVGQLINWMAATIEYYDYLDREHAAQALRAASTRDFAVALISAEKAMNVSARSFRLLSEVLVDFNREILQRLPSAEGDEEREILFSNAILVYETLDFMVRYLEDYQVNGLPELEQLAADVRRRTSSTLADIAKQREDTQALQISEDQKSRFFKEQEDHEAAIKIIQTEWDRFMGEKHDLATSIRSQVANWLAILKVRRAGARTRIEVLGLAAVTRLIRESITDMEQAVLESANLDLAPLTVTRMHRLVGLAE